MSNKQSDNERWRKKYLERAEAFDREEAAWKEYLHLLQRVTVRVSLAAEGVSSRLDGELDKLRSLLRDENHSRAALSVCQESIENAVLALDEQRQSTGEGMLEALLKLVAQLQAVGPPKDSKKALKKYQKGLKSRIDNLRAHPALLQEYSDLQQQALEALLAEGGAEQKEGFLARLFGRTNDSSDTAAEAAEHSESEGDSDSEAAEAATEYSVEATSLDADPADEAIAKEPRYSAVAKHIAQVLLNLLDQLTFTETSEKHLEPLRERIQGGLNWYELGPTLDDVANLVIAAIGRGQKDFESFLKAMDDRLAALQDFLTTSQQYQQESRAASQELDQLVREQVDTIRSGVDASQDIETLKLSVQAQLDTIVSAMDQFVAKEANREQVLEQQMLALQTRLKDMETESADIRKQLQEERKRALTDVLTQLPNREAYEERLEYEFARWQRYGSPVSLVVGDIDYFKQINDNYGHLAGDKVLQLIAKEIRKRVRKTDFLARYGGEEFVIIMPETSAPIALQVMDKTRELVGRCPFHFRDRRVQVTMSFGIAEFRDGLSLEDAFDKADRALYQAKSDGRNRVVVAENQ